MAETKSRLRAVQTSKQGVLCFASPWEAAQQFVQTHYMADEEIRRLHFWQGQFFEWLDGAYHELSLADLREMLYIFGNTLAATGGKPPKKKLVDDVLDALRAVTNLSDRIEPPSWIVHGHNSTPLLHELAGRMIPLHNGLLCTKTRVFYPATPRFFTLFALCFDYDSGAPPPARWIGFLNDLFGDDCASINLLQQWFGYCLLGRTDQQKALMLIGPARGGKGTIARVLQSLLGRSNICSPTLSSLGTQFGLQPLIGKLLAIISDARLGGRADIHSIAENILRVTGEDGVSIPRKFLQDYSATLQARIMVLSNEAPRFSDASSALIRRFLVLQLNRSFLGNEDIGLTDALLAELPGIFLWALDGLDALNDAGRFVQPEAGADLIEDMVGMASPVRVFLDESCELDPASEIPCRRLFEAWQEWCIKSGRQHAGNLQVFGRDLRTVLPSLRTVNRRDMASGRERLYTGIRLAG